MLIRQAVTAYYECYTTDKRIAGLTGAEELCQSLIFESFVPVPAAQEIACCLSDKDCMAGRFIECRWDFQWKPIFVHGC